MKSRENSRSYSGVADLKPLWFTEQKALQRVNVEFKQHVDLLFLLNTFGNDPNSEAVGNSAECANEKLTVALIMLQFFNKGSVNFYIFGSKGL